MAYCKNCGQPLTDGAKFCHGCGKPIEETQRKQEYAGKVIKCPSCGEEIPSFTAICPACGHEVSSQTFSASLKEFVDLINKYDKAIADNPKALKTPWQRWTKWQKFWWVILNIYTLCIPLIFYRKNSSDKMILSLTNVPHLTSEEQSKASLIESFAFVNERETTLEALMFIKSKIAFLLSGEINEKSLYWINMWIVKAEQLYQRANILIKGDRIIDSTYSEILNNKEKVKHLIKEHNKKSAVKIAITVLIITIICVLSLIFGEPV